MSLSEARSVTGWNAKLWPYVGLGLLLVAELVFISILYNHSFAFECRAKAPAAFCAFLSSGVIRAISIVGVLAVFFTARAGILQAFAQDLRPTPDWRLAGLQLVGFAALLLPWFFVSDASGPGAILMAAVLWVGGGLLACVATALAIVPLSGWLGFLKRAGWPLFAVLGFALFSPEIAALFQNVWKFDPLTQATFRSVEAVLVGMGYTVDTDAATHLLGIAEFAVLVGRQCSGVEGFLLITAFMLFYIWLFRDDLKFPQVWLLLPIGLALSWVFNVARIAVLIMIGHHVSPDLAINGFHSHAGWLMFTVLAVGLASVAHQISWFRKGHVAAARPQRTVPPLADDPYAAMILPFIVFMATALLLSTFTELPGLYYPLRFVAMVAVLLFFLRYIRGLDWGLDAVAIGSGVAIGVLWLVTATTAGAADGALAQAVAGLGTAGFLIWVVARFVGTSIAVPIIEELFFRGYVLKRLDVGGMPMRVLAFAVSSGLFAALHDRWFAAFLAGIVFGLVMLRRGRVTDAIQSHMAANVVIALWAVFMRDWAVI